MPQDALPPALVNVREACRFLGIARASLYRLLKAGNLPRPVKLGRSTRWRVSDLQSWVAELGREPG